MKKIKWHKLLSSLVCLQALSVCTHQRFQDVLDSKLVKNILLVWKKGENKKKQTN